MESRWKVRGEINLKQGLKAFFTMIFSCLEDKEKLFEEGPYLFNSKGLQLCYWSKRFSLEKEDFTVAPSWIRMYSLPQEFLEKETLKGIGNTLASFFNISKVTKQEYFTLYAHNCVYMDVSRALLEAIAIKF